MKKIIGLLALLISFQMFAKVTTAGEVKEDKTVSVELKKGRPTIDDSYPRTLIPIACVYANGVVQLSFLEDLGGYTLTVTNQVTGEQWEAVNTPILSTSTVGGNYLIEIVTESGECYYGEYTL